MPLRPVVVPQGESGPFLSHSPVTGVLVSSQVVVNNRDREEKDLCASQVPRPVRSLTVVSSQQLVVSLVHCDRFVGGKTMLFHKTAWESQGENPLSNPLRIKIMR